MANNQAFCVTYGGYDRIGRVWTPYKAIAHSPEEAIAVINTWHLYGATKTSGDLIEVNERTAEKIREIFANGLGTYPSGEPRTRSEELRTKNCGAWGITLYPALADTIEEHERIYKEQCKAAREERKRKAAEERDRRMTEMGRERKGWYAVMMTFHCWRWNDRRGEHQWVERQFSGNCIASSQMDAYHKACQDIEKNTDPFDGQGFEFPDMTNQSMFDATFLGVKTDDGYSVEKWEEWKKNGEI